jgi:hypothetical protein
MALTTDSQIITEAPAMATVDIYLDIHKGIRADLFSVTGRAGSLDPADAAGRAALADAVRFSVDLLVSHAEHEDNFILPVLEVERPDLAEVIAADHAGLEPRMDGLVALAGTVAEVDGADARRWLHALYLDLALFTGDYLRHQETEERVVMPALEMAIGPDAVAALEGAIIASIPPDEMASSLAVMLPAMNLDDRATMLGGMRQDAPAEVFAGVWALAGSVLVDRDLAALGRRLGM